MICQLLITVLKSHELETYSNVYELHRETNPTTIGSKRWLCGQKCLCCFGVEGVLFIFLSHHFEMIDRFRRLSRMDNQYSSCMTPNTLFCGHLCFQPKTGGCQSSAAAATACKFQNWTNFVDHRVIPMKNVFKVDYRAICCISAVQVWLIIFARNQYTCGAKRISSECH